MYNNYNYYPQQTQSTQQTQPTYIRQQPLYMGLKGRPVSSLEEARVSTVDFDGSIFYFPDMANRCIYTKQINMDGTATLNVYELCDTPAGNPISTPQLNNNYITREEFESAIAQIKASIAPNKTVTEPPKTPKPEVLSF